MSNSAFRFQRSAACRDGENRLRRPFLPASRSRCTRAASPASPGPRSRSCAPDVPCKFYDERIGDERKRKQLRSRETPPGKFRHLPSRLLGVATMLAAEAVSYSFTSVAGLMPRTHRHWRSSRGGNDSGCSPQITDELHRIFGEPDGDGACYSTQMAVASSPSMRAGLFEGSRHRRFLPSEMFVSPSQPRHPHYSKLFQKLGAMAPAQFEERRKLADLSFLIQGITFTVYSDGQNTVSAVAVRL